MARLGSGDAAGFMMAYLSWVDRSVIDARDVLEVLSKEKVGWDAFAERQVSLRLRSLSVFSRTGPDSIAFLRFHL